MLDLKYYQNILENQKNTNAAQAEILEEEIDIILHKLKFIPYQQRPSVLVLEQKTNFKPKTDESVQNIIAIAGGTLLTSELNNDVDIILIQQSNDALYSEVIDILQNTVFKDTNAVKANKIYIIQKSDFGSNPEEFLADVEIAAETIQSKYFIFGRQGKDWVQFDL